VIEEAVKACDIYFMPKLALAQMAWPQSASSPVFSGTACLVSVHHWSRERDELRHQSNEQRDIPRM
jgi:hypothetical protein